MSGGHLDDTICAVATSMGEGGIGIVRVSGPQAVSFAAQIVALRNRRNLQQIQSHRLYLGDLVLPQGQQTSPSSPAARLDEVLVTVMRGPRSYTGEDVVEIHCHGGPLILQLACEALIRAGARLAEPGEFTKRAFLNGRLDLTQAEAVLDTIRATTTTGLRVAQDQLKGELGQRVDDIRQDLIALLAHLEAGMDFVEEDVTFIEAKEIEQTLDRVLDALTRLLETADQGRIVREGLRTAIIGRPNVGKSSLLNALLQTNRAIVSHIPGTTRDTLEEWLNINGVPLRLVDTAGLHDAEDSIEQEGIRRTNAAVDQADLLLIVFDGSRSLYPQDLELLTLALEKKRIIVINKSDLDHQISESEILGLLRDQKALAGDPPFQLVRLSAKTGAGLDALRTAIYSLALGSSLEASHSILVSRLRHKTALTQAKTELEHARQALACGLSSECLAVDLRMALTALGEVTGEVSSEDILDKIFREFCIGK